MTQFSIDQATETQLCWILAFATTGCPRCNRTGEISCPFAVGHEGHTNDVIVRMLDEFTAAIVCPTCKGAGTVYALEGVRRESWPGQVPVSDLGAWMQAVLEQPGWFVDLIEGDQKAGYSARLVVLGGADKDREYDGVGDTITEALLYGVALALEAQGAQLA